MHTPARLLTLYSLTVSHTSSHIFQKKGKTLYCADLSHTYHVLGLLGCTPSVLNNKNIYSFNITPLCRATHSKRNRVGSVGYVLLYLIAAQALDFKSLTCYSITANDPPQSLAFRDKKVSPLGRPCPAFGLRCQCVRTSVIEYS